MTNDVSHGKEGNNDQPELHKPTGSERKQTGRHAKHMAATQHKPSTQRPRAESKPETRWETRLTDGGNGGDDLSELQLIQDCRLTGCVETDHENTHLPLGEEFLEQLRECEPHFGSPASTESYGSCATAGRGSGSGSKRG